MNSTDVIPRLSVVVAGSLPGGPPPGLVEALRPWLATGDVEVILATAREGASAPEPGVRVVACRRGATIPELRLAGVRAATAPLVAVTEDFCAPVPGWADALLEACEQGVAEVLGGPVARRSGSAADWALTFIEYGRYFRKGPEGPVTDVPSINVAYDAARLQEALGAGATRLYEVEVHARLLAAGARMWCVPGAVMFDENRKPLGAAARAQFHHGRLFGGERVAGRGAAQRLLRFALAPAVPFVLLSRIAREALAAGCGRHLARALPALAILLAAWTAGEATGSLAGPGESAGRWT